MAKKDDVNVLAALGPQCPMQMNNHVTESWCEQVQFDDLCRGCTRNRGRVFSQYQVEKRRGAGGKK